MLKGHGAAFEIYRDGANQGASMYQELSCRTDVKYNKPTLPPDVSFKALGKRCSNLTLLGC